MSEYQYYEFQALDRPLTQDERAAISQLSSRVKPTATSASFTYSYGDFPGDPKRVLAQYFDIMYYIASWGTQQLAFRFPKSLIDREAIAPYCAEYQNQFPAFQQRLNQIYEQYSTRSGLKRRLREVGLNPSN